MHRSPSSTANNGNVIAAGNAKGDNRNQHFLPASNSNMCNTNGLPPTNVIANGYGIIGGGASNGGASSSVDPTLMQEHFSNSSKKVKEKLMLDEMHELLEEPVEEQVGAQFLHFNEQSLCHILYNINYQTYTD